VPLLGNPQAIDEAWNEAVEQAGGVPTAQTVREVVARKLAATPLPEKKPLHDLEGIDPCLFKLATRAGERCALLLPDSQQVILLHAGNAEYPNSACVLGESHHTTPVR
jgi:hypothetical protein